MTDCNIKIYYYLDGKHDNYNFNEIDKDILYNFNLMAKKTKMSIEVQKLIILRMIESIDNMTGGSSCNRMYLELLGVNFTVYGVLGCSWYS
ncbi:hypothetical protein [Clostridium folliculivorans]|uniref:Uncharacterized protein n=1 Tax=Clostridium folliculivorans TaxID=2886038 RepID=A0A9W5Y182_9CLOT|nr:hypothetical protein [Clostridium folliculivorans]GKU24728.1 hypothetical protein CFOLD11_15540 [Clostridium folliculivorans]GKU30826.1 hypothetical protein CFB3_29330 [Clostridium folliculivorans]